MEQDDLQKAVDRPPRGAMHYQPHDGREEGQPHVGGPHGPWRELRTSAASEEHQTHQIRNGVVVCFGGGGREVEGRA